MIRTHAKAKSLQLPHTSNDGNISYLEKLIIVNFDTVGISMFQELLYVLTVEEGVGRGQDF